MSFINDVLLPTELERPEYEDDTKRIVQVAFKHGVVLTPNQAERVWEAYSESMAAGWMYLPKTDEELWEIIS